MVVKNEKCILDSLDLPEKFGVFWTSITRAGRRPKKCNELLNDTPWCPQLTMPPIECHARRVRSKNAANSPALQVHVIWQIRQFESRVTEHRIRLPSVAPRSTSTSLAPAPIPPDHLEFCSLVCFISRIIFLPKATSYVLCRSRCA